MLNVLFCYGTPGRLRALLFAFCSSVGTNSLSTSPGFTLARRDSSTPLAATLPEAHVRKNASHPASFSAVHGQRTAHAKAAISLNVNIKSAKFNSSATVKRAFEEEKLNLTALACKHKRLGMDFVVLAESHDCVTQTVIDSLNKFASPRRVILVAPAHTCKDLNATAALAENTHCVSEDSLMPEVSYNATQQWLADKFGHNVSQMRLGLGGHHLAGWYLQQFLKMGVAEAASKLNLSDHYVLWDSDMVLLRDYCAFNQEGQANFMESDADYKAVCNKWYEKSFHQLTGLPYKYSDGKRKGFTAHHMVVNRWAMTDFLNTLRAKSSTGAHWSKIILEHACPDLKSCSCGFSEYGSYASWMHHSRPHEVAVVPMQYDRAPLKKLTRVHRASECCPEKYQDVFRYKRMQGKLFVGFERSCNAELHAVSTKTMPR